MSVTQTFELIRQYATALGQPADLMIEVLTTVSDEHSIPLNVYGGGMEAHSEPRNVLDVQSITMTNMMGVAKRSLSIEPGVSLLYGPNGTGKTTAMRALLFALFGGNAAGVRVTEDLIMQGQSDVSAKVEFAGGWALRGCSRKTVSRGKNAGKVETEHELQVHIAGDKANRAKEAQNIIDAWLGVDADFVRRVCCLEQGMLTQVMDEQPARRRELFYRMLALEPAEETRKALSKALDIEERKRGAVASTLETLDAEIKTLTHRRSQYPLEKLVADREALLPQASKASANPQEVKEAREALARRELDLIQTRKAVADRKQYQAKLEELKRDPALAMTFNDLALDIAKAERILGGERASFLNWQTQVQALADRGAKIKGLPPECPTCAAIGKRCEVSPEVKDKALAELRAQYISAKRSLDECQANGGKYAKALEELKGKEKQNVQNRSHAAFVGEQIQLLNEALANQAPIEPIEQIEVHIKELAESVRVKASAGSPEVLKDLSIMDQAISEATSLDAQIHAAQLKKDAATNQAQMTNEQLEAFRFAVAAFAKDGMPLWLARQHLERINAIASEISSLDKYKYKFGPDLDVMIYPDFEGDTFWSTGPELTCGSARERGAVVLMAALGRYLQELSGLSIPFLWVDELPFQDEANAHLVVDMMKKLTKWYPKVVLCASRWEEFLGQFDHEISLQPEDLSIELDRQRQARGDGTPLERELEMSPPERRARVSSLPRTVPAQDSTELPAAIAKAASKVTAIEAKAERITSRQHVALCSDCAKAVDETKVAVIPSQKFHCVECLKKPKEIARDVVAEAEAALSDRDPLETDAKGPQMDADMEGCPF